MGMRGGHGWSIAVGQGDHGGVRVRRFTNIFTVVCPAGKTYAATNSIAT